MPKTEIIPCSKEEMDKIIECSVGSDFYYMLFMTAKLTGRRLGELVGNQRKEVIGRKVVGKKTEYDEHGKEVALAKTITVYKIIPGEFDGGVQVKDIDFEKNTIKIWVLKRRKSMQDETILTEELSRILRHYVVKTELKEDDYIFRGKSYRGIQDSIKRYGVKAGINHKVSFHNFRHYFVTELKRKGYSNDKIAKLTGHKTVSSLTIYDHIVANDLKDEVMQDLRDL